MKRNRTALGAAAILSLALGSTAIAQNLVISNARIIDGTGKVIERGSVVARDGKIVSVGSGDAPAGSAGPRIDAHGMTVMASFIDAHRHIFRGEPKAWLRDKAADNMKSFIDAGFTTVFSMGDDPQGILELRRRLNAGEIPGPTLYAVRMLPLAAGFPQPSVAPPPSQWNDPGRNDPARPPYRPVKALPAIPDDAIRASVDKAKADGFDAIKTILVYTPGGPEPHALGAIVDEAHKQGLRVFTHATAVPDALTAINAHVDVLAHTPHIGRLEEDEPALRAIAGAHIPMVSTLSVFIPHFDEQNHPLYRDGGPFPMPRPLSSAGQGPVNARLLWDAGVTYAYGTDTQWDPRDTLKDELRALNLVFSPVDIIKIMGPNAAAAIDKGAEIGTLEPGKLANIVIVSGDPLDDIFSLTHVMMVVKDGKLVVDKTAGARAGKSQGGHSHRRLPWSRKSK